MTSSTLQQSFSALRVRNYRLYWIGQLISISGTWMQTTAQAWVVLSLSGSALALGTVTTLQFLPITLLSLFGGVIADRIEKRKLVLITQTLAMLQAAVFGMLVASAQIQVWHIYILAAVQGIINAIDNPVRQAFASELVGKDDRANAIALNSTLFNAARVIGPGLAGVLIAQFGAATALFLNAASFSAIIIGLLMMNPLEFFAKSGKRVHASPKTEFIEGLRYVLASPPTMAVMIVVAAIGTFGYNFSIVLPLLGGFVLNTTAVEFGALGTALGVGSLLGALGATRYREVTFAHLVASSAAFSVLLGLVAISTNLVLSEVLLAGIGFFGVSFSTSAATRVQISVPDQLRGRVTSLYFLLFAGSTPIGASLIGYLSSVLNVPDALLACAALCLLGLGIAIIYERRSRRH